jgi:hypothetical protein
VDPEVVTQFNCLQQTGNFCPSASNGPAAMSSNMTSSPTMSTAATMTSASAADSTTAHNQSTIWDLEFLPGDIGLLANV